MASVINGINRQRDIDPYLALQSLFQNGSIIDNGNYKTTYRKYWQLNTAKLSDYYCEHYFRVMEKYRNRDDKDIKGIIRELYEVPSNSKGKKTLQFAFATKLLHTIDNTQPVYDRLIADFYFLPQVKPIWKYEKKLSAYLRAYDFLRQEQKKILNNSMLLSAITRLRLHFQLPETYTDQKIIDTLFWKFTMFLRRGAIMEGKIEYS